MQKVFTIIMSLFLGGMIMTACETEDLMFQEDSSYIYFDIPFKVDQYRIPTTIREDTILHSFAFDNAGINEYTFKLAVNVAGLPFPEDRRYKIEIVPEYTNLTDEQMQQTAISETVIHKNRIFDTLYIKVNRPVPAEGLKKLAFRLLPNDNFNLSDSALLVARLCYTNDLTAPAWWAVWEYYMGTFCPETFLQWKKIYYEGVDPNGYYWDDMPKYADADWYPVTFMFLGQLKLYFEKNETYPNGDRSKPRIRINI